VTTLLSIRGLRVAFKTDDGYVTAVDGLDYELAPGETLGIVGESGSGKSVTNLAVMRLLPPPPASRTEGQILFRGLDLLRASPKTLRGIRGRRIAMIFQDPMTSLNPFLRVGTQLVEMLRVHNPKMSKGEAKRRSLAMLERVGIPAPDRRFRQYPHEFSGGMRQRVMIAMMLLNDPELLIADEPTTALDVTIQAQILELLKDLQSELQMAITLITHDLGVVAGMANHILVMYSGKVMEESSASELFETPSHPYTIGLMRSIPRPDLPEGKRLFSIPGRPPDLDKRPPGCPFAPRCDWARDICHHEHPAETRISETHRVFCWAVDDVRAAVAAGKAGLTAEERAQ